MGNLLMSTDVKRSPAAIDSGPTVGRRRLVTQDLSELPAKPGSAAAAPSGSGLRGSVPVTVTRSPSLRLGCQPASDLDSDSEAGAAEPPPFKLDQNTSGAWLAGAGAERPGPWTAAGRRANEQTCGRGRSLPMKITTLNLL